MENTTATLHGSDILQKPGQLIDENKWEDTIAHELFHHWFGDLVTAESWSNLRLMNHLPIIQNISGTNTNTEKTRQIIIKWKM
jgi:hypothetical protein